MTTRVYKRLKHALFDCVHECGCSQLGARGGVAFMRKHYYSAAADRPNELI